MVSYLVVIVVCGGVMVPAAIMLDSFGGQTASILHDARALSPIAAVLSLLRARGLGRFRGEDFRTIHRRIRFFRGGGFMVVVVCLMILVVQLRRPPAGIRANERRKTVQNRGLQPMGLLNPHLDQGNGRTNHLSSGRWMVRIFLWDAGACR